ncbi:MAG: tetratricopeptide repeat protein [Endomicrobiia bacterium]
MKEKATGFIITILLIFVISLNSMLIKYTVSPFSKINETKLLIDKYFILDSIGIIFGLRKVVSDLAWIQLLQYYGSEPEEIEEDESKEISQRENKEVNDHYETHNHVEHITKIQPGKYKQLLKYLKRVVLLDPLYNLVYFYGIGSLAWNLDRPEEALDLANIGLKNLEFQKEEPTSDYWEIVKYQQAIYYKVAEKYKEMLDKLEEIVQSGKSPNVVKSILANLYKKYGMYEKSLKLWEELLLSGDTEYVERAKIQIIQIKNLIKEGKIYEKSTNTKRNF